MTKEKFEKTMLKLSTVTNAYELKKVLEEEKIHYAIFEGQYYRDKEHTAEILKQIARIAGNLKESFEFELKDVFGHFHILGISFTNDRPKVSTGYVWSQHLDIKQENTPVEHEYRVIKEINDENEIIERKSYLPIGLAECFEYNNNVERYQNATNILFETLKEQYLNEKKHKLSKSK